MVAGCLNADDILVRLELVAVSGGVPAVENANADLELGNSNLGAVVEVGAGALKPDWLATAGHSVSVAAAEESAEGEDVGFDFDFRVAAAAKAINW